jgi:hypothetical protein
VRRIEWVATHTFYPDILASNYNFIYFPDSNKVKKDIEITNP